MGKKKNWNIQAQPEEQGEEQPSSENPSAQNNESSEPNATYINKNSNSKPNEENNNKDNNKQNPKGAIVLGVYMHCEACAEKVVKSLRGFDDRWCLIKFSSVEEVVTDTNEHKVTVKGKKADPTKVAQRLRNKTGKHVDLISPVPSKDKKEEKKEQKKEEKKPEMKVVEVVLKVYMHCEGCARDVKNCIRKMQGVHTVEPDMEKTQVKVNGAFDPEKLVKLVTKKAGKHAEIVKPGKKDEKDEKEGEKKDGKKNSMQNYPPEVFYAPQLFSDENPHACSVM
ncbi:hypothetical protein RJ639_032999 [Escallonia herrerae]|uniref:HMA domain-containing protein n=1 Tax=Escallonia herrerae TaxID=1293975 RepID=A0AA88WX58_9ASTE|nr:hypothetical protein RJ639_032999 [Escallonia herrerae]